MAETKITPHDLLSYLIEWRDQLAASEDDGRFVDYCINNLKYSKSQLLQDLWVTFELNDLRGGFFVEFGALDGVHFSNSYWLEKHMGWRGILAEPGRSAHGKLFAARDCAIDRRCVWAKTGEMLEFNETADSALSTIDSYSSSDQHAPARVKGTRYTVETISLADLLDYHRAPRRIDYLSVDTEGSELAILQAFDFDIYDIRAITVEHNFQPNREALHALLSSKGFQRKFEQFSRWDDWYLKKY